MADLVSDVGDGGSADRGWRCVLAARRWRSAHGRRSASSHLLIANTLELITSFCNHWRLRLRRRVLILVTLFSLRLTACVLAHTILPPAQLFLPI